MKCNIEKAKRTQSVGASTPIEFNENAILTMRYSLP